MAQIPEEKNAPAKTGGASLPKFAMPKMPFLKPKDSKEGKPTGSPPAENGGKKKVHPALILLGKILVVLMCLGVIAGSALGVFLSLYLVNATKNDDEMLNLNNLKLSFTTILYAKDEKTGQFIEYQKLNGEECRIWVDLAKMPKWLPQAYIAVEDKDFKDHEGVNWKRTFAAFVNQFIPILSSMQGGSTITQQLVKNITFDDEQNAARKLREMFRALILEKEYSKDLILEGYLNTLRLTGNIAGVQTGANLYFGKDVKDLTIAESASLAAITKNPAGYDPYKKKEDHLTRRNYIIGLMADQQYITAEQEKAAKAEPLNLKDAKGGANFGTNTYFTDKVVSDVIADLVKEKGMTRTEATKYLYNGGLRIYTTLVPSLQRAMDKEMQYGTVFQEIKHSYDVLDAKGNKTGEKREEIAQAAMISLTYDGGIAACVGGLGPKAGDRVLNRATDSVRQVGSTMKAVAAYPLGIDYNRITYSSGFINQPIKIKDYQTGVVKDWPVNYSTNANPNWTNETIPVYAGVARSLNTIAVRVGQRVGEQTMYDFVTRTLHVTSLDPTRDVSLAPLVLGAMTHGISPLELAACYMMYGSGGTYATPHSYTMVTDANDNIILEKKVRRTQAISPETAFIMNKILAGVLQPGGTGAGLAPRGPAVGKTGTTSDNKDHWFVGVTPNYVTATWWGFDNPGELTKFQWQTHPPTTAWRNVMNTAQANLPAKDFPVASKVVTDRFCMISGDLATSHCPKTAVGYYKPDQKPGRCVVHTAAPPPKEEED